MSIRKETERVKLIQEKCQTLLTQMLRDEDNKYCVDCDAKGPRWASWNLGVFLCIRCAGIHRNLGVHISRVKSVNLDSWTPEQVVSLQQMGNSRARAVYEAQLPDGFRRPQTDSALESFIRAKYEHKKYLAREWVPPPPPKVDWAKEIDEEIEKQKRKKKSQNLGSSIGGISSPSGGSGNEGRKNTAVKSSTIPAPLPKPKSSSSPKVNRTENSHHNQNNSSDLLGLSSPVNSSDTSKKSNENGADGFSSFLSAPVCPVDSSKLSDNKNVSNVNSLAKEEEDFFKQSSAGSLDKDKGKLTKDSILALYGTAPSNSIGQFNNSALVGYNSTFHNQPGTVAPGQFIPIPIVPSQPPQAFAATGLHIPQSVAGISSVVSGNVVNATQFGAGNMNLAGMPPGLLGPPQHQPQQYMSTPSSVTSMYNAPVMTAPGAFTSAIQQQQIIPQPTFAQFPPQAFGPAGIPIASPLAGIGFNTTPAIATSTLGGLSSLGGGPVAVQVPTAAPTISAIPASVMQPTSTNLSQQFGNLNLGNVWQ